MYMEGHKVGYRTRQRAEGRMAWQIKENRGQRVEERDQETG